MSRQEVQELEDRASEHYLRGEYQEAREAWQQVLALEPDNEQAAEGIRLSAVYIDGTEGMPSDLQAAAAPAPAAPPAAVALGSETMLLDPELLDSIVHAPSGAPSKATDAPPAPARTELDRQGEGFDFGTLEELDSIPLFNTPPPPPLGAVSESEAANELNRRVQDLLTEARSLHAEGKNQEALGVIARIAILDEESSEAHELEGSVRTAMERAVLQVDGWIAEGVQAFDRGEIEEARSLFERVLSAAPEHREALHYMEAMPAKNLVRTAPGSAPAGDEAQPGSEPFQADELLPGMAKSDTGEDTKRKLMEELDAAEQAVPLARPVGIPVARPSAEASPREKAPATPPTRMTKRSSRRPMLAGGLAILALGGLGAWWFLGSSKESPQSTAAPAQPARPTEGARRAAEAARAAAPSQAGAAQAPSDARSLGQILEDAKKSMASQDYAAAVVDYNRAIQRDSMNSEAKEGLVRAGEAYKARKLELEQLDKVKMAFGDQEFTSALHVLYRLPPSADKARVDRYKANGWFNLGVIALRAGECQQARSHFGEVLGIRPGDEDAKRLRAFAEKYGDGQKDRTFYDQVEQLSFRGVDD